MTPAIQAIVDKLLGEAKALAMAIQNARTPQDAQSLVSALSQIAGNPLILASSEASKIVSGFVDQGRLTADILEATYNNEQANREAPPPPPPPPPVAPISEATDPLAANLLSNGLLLTPETNSIQSINPKEMIPVAAMQEDGRAERTAENKIVMSQTLGQELRNSKSIVPAFAQQDKLNPAATVELNMMLYNSPTVPEDEELRLTGIKRLRQAVLDIEAKTIADAPNEELREAATQRAQEMIKNIEKFEAVLIHNLKARTDPTLTPIPKESVEEAQKILQDETQAIRIRMAKDTEEIARINAENQKKSNPAAQPLQPGLSTPSSPDSDVELRGDTKIIGDIIKNPAPKTQMINKFSQLLKEAGKEVEDIRDNLKSFLEPLKKQPPIPKEKDPLFTSPDAIINPATRLFGLDMNEDILGSGQRFSMLDTNERPSPLPTTPLPKPQEKTSASR